MKNMNAITAVFVALALGSMGLAIVAAPNRGNVASLGGDETGKPFYPDFKDPDLCRSIQVATFNTATLSPEVFHVEFRDGAWVIPSHAGYPADGERKIATAAVNYVDVVRAALRTSNPSDHALLGVVDPLEDNAATRSGHGKRVTFKDGGGKTLVDFIIGNEVEHKSGYHFTRLPGSNAVFEAKISADVDTSFGNWIEKDILKLNSWKIQSMTINNYAVSESGGFGGAQLVPEDTLHITKDKDRKWVCADLGAGVETDEEPIKELVKTVDLIAFADVKRKPDSEEARFNITKFLEAGNAFKLTPPAKDIAPGRGTASIGDGEGFYYDPVNGMLLGGAGDCTIKTDDGIVYLLTWGRIVIDAEGNLAATGDGKGGQEQGDRRYLCITAFFDASLKPEPKKPEPPVTKEPSPGDSAPKDEKAAEGGDKAPDAAESPEQKAYKTALTAWEKAHKTWEDEVAKAKEEVKALQVRLAHWYYIIPDADYRKIRLSRDAVTKKASLDDDKDMVELEHGLKFKDSKVGTGAVADVGKTIKVKYVGKLSDGSIFDQTTDTPATFVLRSPGLIEGWVKGIPGMKVGGKRRLVIPGPLAYGERGSPPKIGPNATLIFEIELVGVE